ncbi:hypothetical protein CSUI_009302 [Cystoisospora suis]|uniref:Uncharacterized protein n=1 Tax=Cystoisospora suis TaxID=483139 RepID=A0A2C6KJR0_9APIC|nr:hypothetical protein CSUI_009302 [Cystoisospora suis]
MCQSLVGFRQNYGEECGACAVLTSTEFGRRTGEDGLLNYFRRTGSKVVETAVV